ncbi:MAG: hypothetical protein WA880_16655 [Ornithinimicrobium sp.]
MGMEDHPERLERPFGSFDPQEPFTITYGDLIAARNVTGHLIEFLDDPVDPPSDFRRDFVRLGVAAGTIRDSEAETDRFGTFDEVMVWLKEFRQRLTNLLPLPKSGPVQVMNPDPWVQHLDGLRHQVPTMSAEEAEDNRAMAAREFTANSLHERRGLHRQGDTDETSRKIRSLRATAAAELWITVSEHLNTLDQGPER